jgi:hypothetical protein
VERTRSTVAHGWGTFTAGALFAVLVMLGVRGG